MLVGALSVGVRDGAAALGEGGRLTGVCALERVTRVRGGPNLDLVPYPALDTLLQRIGRSRTDIGRIEWVGDDRARPTLGSEPLADHLAHACTAYLTSPFPRAAILICDRDLPRVSIWKGSDGHLSPVTLDWTGPGFADVYAVLAGALGFHGEASGQRFEALARLKPDGRDAHLEGLIALRDTALVVDPALPGAIAERIVPRQAPDDPARATVAAALQARLGDLLVEFLTSVRARLGVDTLCVGGSFFYHSSINTRIRQAGVFRDVFVPVDPGNTGLVAGTVLHALGVRPSLVPPFLGPSYTPEETKEVLDNCKLQYAWETDANGIAAAVEALVQGRLVGWFDDSMEWGPRALGARSILASPQAPYVLENLNRFLKHRDPWRGYALSGLRDAVATHFEGPSDAPYMECDYRPRDRARFGHVLPSPGASVRVQTVGDTAPPRFVRLLQAFEAATGLPFLVNTSFNGFHEPSVCSPRDAVRVFYGSGLDLLVLNQFVLRK